MKHYLLIGAGVLVLAGILLSGTVLDRPPPDRAERTVRVVANSKGHLGLVRPTSTSLALTPLSAWSVIAADVLEPTYVSGFTVTGVAADFASVRTLRVEFASPRTEIPIAWYRDDQFVLPVDPVRYYLGDAGLMALEFDLLGPGEYYLLQQNQHHDARSLFSGLELTHELRDAYAGQFRFHSTNTVVPIGQGAARERGVATPIPIDRFTITLQTGDVNRSLPVVGDVTVDGVRRIAFGGAYDCDQVLANDTAALILSANIGPERRTRSVTNWMEETIPERAWMTTDSELRTRLDFHFDGFSVCGSGI